MLFKNKLKTTPVTYDVIRFLSKDKDSVVARNDILIASPLTRFNKFDSLPDFSILGGASHKLNQEIFERQDKGIFQDDDPDSFWMSVIYRRNMFGNNDGFYSFTGNSWDEYPDFCKFTKSSDGSFLTKGREDDEYNYFEEDPNFKFEDYYEQIISNECDERMKRNNRKATSSFYKPFYIGKIVMLGLTPLGGLEYSSDSGKFKAIEYSDFFEMLEFSYGGYDKSKYSLPTEYSSWDEFSPWDNSDAELLNSDEKGFSFNGIQGDPCSVLPYFANKNISSDQVLSF